jgi:hypothetical protein
MRPFVEKWEVMAAGLLQRVYRESVGHVVDPKTVELLKRLEKYPGVKTLGTIQRTHSPVLPITFVKGSERFSYFSFITTVGTPQSITECMFPLEPESN